MARYIIREAMTRQTSNTPLLIIPLMLHIRKPTRTPTPPNIRGMITSNPDVLTIQKQDVTDRSV